MQNPPPDQQNYGTPYSPPPPPTGTKTATGLEPNLAGALSYIWIVGLIFFFIEKENRFIRFHAMQSVLYGLLWTVVMIVLMIVNVIIAIVATAGAAAAGSAGGIISLLVWLISMVIWLVVPLAYLGGLILAAVKANRAGRVCLGRGRCCEEPQRGKV
jgi:uncharacterized membrane protein